MQGRNKTFLKMIKWVVIPTGFLLLAVGLTAITMMVSDKSFLVFSHTHPQSSFTNSTFDRLTKGQKITGEFLAKEDNLGIVAIRFEQFLRIPYKDEDQLVFRIKEKSAKNWYYQGKYMSGLTFEVPFLPFGFPPIASSKDRTYIFELESLRGNQKNGLILSKNLPNLVSKYQVSKAELMADKNALTIFLGKKLFTGLNNIEIVYAAFVFLMPFVLYIVYLTPARGSLPIISYVPLILLIIWDIFILQTNNDLVYLIYMIMWYVSMRIQKQRARSTFLFGIILLLLTPIFYSLDSVSMAVKANVWAYAFMTTATLQILFENVNKKNNKK